MTVAAECDCRQAAGQSRKQPSSLQSLRSIAILRPLLSASASLATKRRMFLDYVKPGVKKWLLGEFSLSVASTEQELREAFELVYSCYVEKGYIYENPRRIRVRAHDLLPGTFTFLTKSCGRVFGTISLISDSPIGVPMDESFSAELNAIRLSGGKVAEMSALATLPHMRHSAGFLVSWVAAILLAKQKGITHICVAASPEVKPFLRDIFLFKSLGRIRSYSKEKFDPVSGMVIDLRTWEDDLYAAYQGYEPAHNAYTIIQQLKREVVASETLTRCTSLPAAPAKASSCWSFALQGDILESFPKSHQNILRRLYSGEKSKAVREVLPPKDRCSIERRQKIFQKRLARRIKAVRARSEEFLNVVTGGVGFLAALTAAIPPLLFLLGHACFDKALAYGVYLLSIVLVFLASTAFHSAKSARRRVVLEVLDHTCIMLAIAGTYTPIIYSCLPHASRSSLIFALWTVTISLIVIKWNISFRKKGLGCLEEMLPGVYLAIVFALILLTAPYIQETSRVLYLAGLAVLSGGLIVFLNKSFRYNHAVWHALVLLGLGIQYVATMLLLTAPTA